MKALALDGVLSVSSDGLALSGVFSDDSDVRREEVGESDFLGGASWMMDLGRYLGRPDDVAGRGRKEDDRVTVPTTGGDAASAGFASARAVDPLLRVTVFESGESTFASGEVTSLVARETVAARWTALERRDSLTALFEPLSLSLPSLFMTSANAFPTEANPRVWRIDDDLVALGATGGASVAGMAWRE